MSLLPDYGDAYAGDYSLPRNSSEYNLECCTKEKLLATKKALDAQKIPINYIQLDVRLCLLLLLPLLSRFPYLSLASTTVGLVVQRTS